MVETGGFNIFCPFGNNDMVLLGSRRDEERDEDDDEHDVPTQSSVSGADPSATVDSDTPFLPDVEDVAQDAVANLEPAAKVHESYLSIPDSTKKQHKSTILRIFSSRFSVAESRDRLKRVRGFSRHNDPPGLDSSANSDEPIPGEPMVLVQDPAAILVRSNGHIWLAVVVISAISRGTKQVETLPKRLLGEPNVRAKVQIMELESAKDTTHLVVEEGDWEWTGKFASVSASGVSKSCDVDGAALQLLNPAVLPARNLAKKGIATYHFKTVELLAIAASMEVALRGTKKLPEIAFSTSSPYFPYRTTAGYACFICNRDGISLEQDHGLCLLCPTATLKVSAPAKLVEHMAIHILFDKSIDRNASPCGFCLSTDSFCSIVLIKKKGSDGAVRIDTERSRCPNIANLGLATAANSSKNNPCTNRPLVCPVSPCPDIIWKYNLETHIRTVHPAANISNYKSYYELADGEETKHIDFRISVDHSTESALGEFTRALSSEAEPHDDEEPDDDEEIDNEEDIDNEQAHEDDDGVEKEASITSQPPSPRQSAINLRAFSPEEDSDMPSAGVLPDESQTLTAAESPSTISASTDLDITPARAQDKMDANTETVEEQTDPVPPQFEEAGVRRSRRVPQLSLKRRIVLSEDEGWLVKTHFYQIWVLHKVLRKTKEMRRFHALLAELRLPAFLGRLPSLMGVPAGGSLTADQWLIAAIVVCPILVPQIWAEYMSADVDQVLIRRVGGIKATIAEKKAAAAEARRKKAEALAAERDKAPPAIEPRPQRARRQTARAAQMDVDPNEEALDAGAVLDERDGEYEDIPAVKLLLAHPITDSQIDEAEKLLRSYLPELCRLYGTDVIKPNHHYATHTPEDVRNYGPLQEFWTFLFERINKVLKSFNSSNHSGGELETSFFREFHRTIQTSRILAQAAHAPSGSPLHRSAEAMYHATSDDRGTIQALARQLDKAHEDGGIVFQLSPKFSIGPVSAEIFNCALDALRIQLPGLNLRSSLALPSTDTPSYPLFNKMKRFPYAVISNRRYYSAEHAKSNYDSLVLVRTEGVPGQPLSAGELREIFVVDDPKIGRHYYGFVRWLVPAEVPAGNSVWAAWKQYAPLRAQIWELNTYLKTGDVGPGNLIQLNDIICHVVRTDVVIEDTKYWLTVGVKA
ncbi:hypothetical protein MSAN_00774200 [Mycena sanguinolenta]|uniref:Uncharacterized protein n=1 Tax=Mycena sanguinolenta TaxID=230812 RepID=A0A8H6Z612_9AGAR|nr:hypothetical protein MSAN_00774200 [Mycena sanguinolenta]